MSAAGFIRQLNSTLLRYWHTLRWLRPVQFYGRLWFKAYRPRPDLHAAPASRAMTGAWQLCERMPTLVAENQFRFLSVTRTVATAADWNRADWPKLWLYNAHYFDDLTAMNANERVQWQQALIERWIVENPPGQGNGWEPYPTSLRLVNWCKWLCAGNAASAAMQHSLAVQARWLRQRLEHHLLGNHLWANAKALIFAGTLFSGSEAVRWRAKGLHLLRRELHEQILPDGGHFERSPMYHAILTEDVLDLVQLAQCFPDVFSAGNVRVWQQTAVSMLRWLQVMSHPDGEISFFNDAALGIAPSLSALQRYASVLGVATEQSDAQAIALQVLPQSGYVRMTAGAAVLLADVAPVGPDYLPGHAHADSLSFELSLRGQRVLVNGGTSTYENNAERLRQRGTAAHNTVQVDGENSSEVWSAFRVARRARVHDVVYEQKEDCLLLSAWHDGYQRLAENVKHQRQWQLGAKHLTITDTLQGRFCTAQAHFLFAPEASLRWQVEGGQGELVESVWHPQFGVAIPTKMLRVRFDAPRCCVQFFWD